MPRQQSQSRGATSDSESERGAKITNTKSGYKVFYQEQRNIILNEINKQGYQKDAMVQVNRIISEKWEKLNQKQKAKYRQQEDINSKENSNDRKLHLKSENQKNNQKQQQQQQQTTKRISTSKNTNKKKDDTRNKENQQESQNESDISEIQVQQVQKPENKVPQVTKKIQKEKNQNRQHSKYIEFFKRVYQMLKERFPKRNQFELSKAVALEWQRDKIKNQNIKLEKFNQKEQQIVQKGIQKLENQQQKQQKQQNRIKGPKTLNQIRKGYMKINGEDVQLPKKPLVSYMIFIKEQRPEIIKQNKDISNVDISRKAAEMWKSLSEEQKQVYHKQYEDEKIRYQHEKEEFEEKYQVKLDVSKKQQLKQKARNIQPKFQEQKQRQPKSQIKRNIKTNNGFEIFSIMSQEVPKNFKI